MAKVHLVLGSGGARGMAHIGVIESLERDGHEIVEVIGCSMGAVVGGIYAAGFLKDYKAWLLTLTRSSVWKLMDFTFTKQGFVRGERVFEAMMSFIGKQQIEDLKIPFRAVATDIENQAEVIFSEGDLFRALRASISIPGIFTPVKDNEKLLVDGGVLNPLPLNLVEKSEGHIVVAVNINAKPVAKPKNEVQSEKSGVLSAIFQKGLGSRISNGSEPLSLLNLLQTSYDVTQDRLTEVMIAHYKPEVLVNIPRTSCGIFEFYKAYEIMNLGESCYREACRNKASLT